MILTMQYEVMTLTMQLVSAWLGISFYLLVCGKQGLVLHAQ